jgi:hypothetical protein
MNRRLAEAVIATFRDNEKAAICERLRRFRVHDWKRNSYWLDASGLALYFLDRLKTLQVEQVLPPSILAGLEERLADNGQRSKDLFEEFLRINQAFHAAGLRYVNLKGFSLIPDYCREPSLRCQFDLDFLASAGDANRCRGILETLGYAVAGRGENVLEFKSGAASLPAIGELYKPRKQRSVEVHFLASPAGALGLSGDPLERAQEHAVHGTTFPALSDIDSFLSQANHLFRHLQSEWTRISWLLEFKTFIAFRRDQSGFWAEVGNRAAGVTDGPLAVAVSTWLATEAFGQFAPASLTQWSVDAIPAKLRQWMECYGRKILLSDFPGSKLYLLLEEQLRDRGAASQLNWKKVFPLHRPPQITFSSGRGSGVRGIVAQTRYMFFRLRFHLREGIRLLLEAWRWKRIVGASGWNEA